MPNARSRSSGKRRVEIVADFNLTLEPSQHPTLPQTPTRNEPRARLAGLGDDDFLALGGLFDQPPEMSLGLMDVNVFIGLD